MSDGVKYIFKVLFKVPIYILITYLIFNGFAFMFVFYEMLGISYVVMQTAVENNYIPQQELENLNNYLADIDKSEVIDNVSLVLENEDDNTIPEATVKRQYGSPVTVGVRAHYNFIWPFAKRGEITEDMNNIEFIYTVPGLKYYPDLE